MYHRFRNHFGRNRCYSNMTWVKWKLALVHLEIVLILKQDTCTVCTKCTIGSEITLSTPDGTPKWRRSRERSFQSVWRYVNIDARLVHVLRQTYHRFRNHFGRHRCYSYVTWVNWKLALVYLEIVLISSQDRCTVCAKGNIGSKIILDAPDCTPR
jgi:hypothetical protein